MKVAFYRSTRHGWRGIGNRLVRWRTNSIYSHCELVLEAADGYPATIDGQWCIGATAADVMPAYSPTRVGGFGGVRGKRIDLSDGQWDVVDFDQSLAPEALTRAKACLGLRYDLRGIAGFILRWTRHRDNRIHCSALIVWCLFGVKLAEMYSPVMALDLVQTLGAPK